MMTDKLRGAAQAALKWLQSTEAQSMEEYLQVVNGLRAALAEPEKEYICKCGLRVVPHQCKTGKEF
jgi:hypothetical protein